MGDSKLKYSSTVAGVICALLLLASVAFVVWRANRPYHPGRQAVTDQLLAGTTESDKVIVSGTIADDSGLAIPEAKVVLSLHNGDGEPIWRLSRPVKSDGSFYFRREDLPAIPNLYAGLIAAEAPNYLAEKTNVSVNIVSPPAIASVSPAPPAVPPATLQGTTISPQRVHLRLVSYSPWLTLVLLIPAIFGLFFAVLHLTQFVRGLWVTYWYAIGTTVLWGLIVGALVFLYINGRGLIPLFWPDLFVSSGIIIFAFIGNVTYVAHSLHEKGRDFFFEADEKTRTHVLQTLGGRILVAPYIALAAYGIFAATFPALRTGAFAAFFGFFTGLWIKPVLEALNDIGLRLLSVEERIKVAAQVTRANTVAPPTQTSTTDVMRPEQAFLDAVAAARPEFLQKKGVIGVDSGFKSSGGSLTGQRAIIVYVYEKEEPDPGDRVPETFMGFPTDVVPLPPADPTQLCRPEVFNLSWEKLNQDNNAFLESAGNLPQDQHVDIIGQVLVLADPSVFFTINSRNQKEFDAKRAFQAVQTRAGDKFDFVAFIIDLASGLDFGNYNVPIHNDVKGINHFKTDFYSVRGEWGTNKLLACQVLSLRSPDFRTYLHELAHSWCAYATFKDPTSQTSQSTELLLGGASQQGLYHWGEAFDDGRSCMDYDLTEWIANGNGTFTRNEISQDSDFNYCPLDLYLMGLIPPAQVGPLRILQNRMVLDPDRNIYQATVKTIGIEDVIASCGQRIPATSGKNFRQALVVVSNDRDSGRVVAQQIENDFRKQYEKQFARATGGRATLTTTVS